MPTGQLLLCLPNTLIQRFRRSVPGRQRSEFVRALLEQALPPADDDQDLLYLAALAVESDERLNGEMAEWEQAAVADGLSEFPHDPPT